MSARNHLYLRAQMAKLGLNRRDLAELTDVRHRTVGHWLSGRNTIPGNVWSALATVREENRQHVVKQYSRWLEEDRPRTFTVVVHGDTATGRIFAALADLIEQLEAENVHVLLLDRAAPSSFPHDPTPKDPK